MQGQDFLSASLSGFAGSLGASAWSIAFGSKGASMIAFGALSGGVASELSGGNFWQGAITGGIVAGLNHAMHRLGGPGDGKKKITATQALEKYRSGKGGVVDVDLSSIDFSNADLAKPVRDKNGNTIAYRVNLDGSAFSNADDAIVHGTITVERVKGNHFRVVKDPELGCRCGKYDFEQHEWEPWYSKRNLATRYAGFLNRFDSFNLKYYSNAKPFTIRYNGTVKIGK